MIDLAANSSSVRPVRDVLNVDYRPLPSVVDGPAALAANVPLLWDQAPNNQSFRFQKGDAAAVQAGLAAATHVAALEIINNRLVIAPLGFTLMLFFAAVRDRQQCG